MIDLKEFQKKVYQHKKEKGFNVTDVSKEVALLHEEVSEMYHAYRKKLPELGEEMADVFIYLLGLAEILEIDLEQELLKKHNKNLKREYKKINGVLTRTKEG